MGYESARHNLFCIGSQTCAVSPSLMKQFSSIGPPATPDLVAALNIENLLFRKGVPIALGKIGPAAKNEVLHLLALADAPLIGFHAKEALAGLAGSGFQP